MPKERFTDTQLREALTDLVTDLEGRLSHDVHKRSFLIGADVNRPKDFEKHVKTFGSFAVARTVRLKLVSGRSYSNLLKHAVDLFKAPNPRQAIALVWMNQVFLHRIPVTESNLPARKVSVKVFEKLLRHDSPAVKQIALEALMGLKRELFPAELEELRDAVEAERKKAETSRAASDVAGHFKLRSEHLAAEIRRQDRKFIDELHGL